MPKKSAAKKQLVPVIETPATAAIEQRHRVFAEAYLVHGNATQAAKEAGFGHAGAHVTGSRILDRPEVQLYISSRRKELEQEYGLDRGAVIGELKAIGHSRIGHYTFDDNGYVQLAPGAPANAMAAVAKLERSVHIVKNAKGKEIARTVKNKLALWNKNDALKTETEILELTGKNAYPAAVRAAVGVAVQTGGAQSATQQQTKILVQVAVVAE